MQFLCILSVLLLALAGPADARPKFPTLAELTEALPPEMLYNGKPIDPACIEAASPTEGDSAPQDLETCAHQPDGQAIMGEMWTSTSRTLGYNYSCTEDGNASLCGMAGYKYAGKTDGGFVVQTMSSSGGTGTFTSVVLLKRNGDTITTDLIQPTGDRCDGGIAWTTVKDGKPDYAYQVTSEQLYNDYKSGEGRFSGYHGSALDCMAVIHKTGDTVQSIELIRTPEQLGHDDACAANAYRAEVKAHGASLSEDQMRKFITKIEDDCIAADEGK